MEFSFGIDVLWLCEFIAEVVLAVVLTYTWARPLRWLIAATAAMDIVKVLVHKDYHTYAHLWGAWRIVEVCWLAWIAGHFLGLLAPKLRDSTVIRIPYAIVVSAAILNGPPRAMDDFYTFQKFGLMIVIFTVIYGVFTAVAIRFEDITLTLGLLAALQIIAGEVMLGMGYHPKVSQMCWLVGLALVTHTVFTYEPDVPIWTGGRGQSWCPPVSRDSARL
jgi:hypothetical protein